MLGRSSGRQRPSPRAPFFVLRPRAIVLRAVRVSGGPIAGVNLVDGRGLVVCLTRSDGAVTHLCETALAEACRVASCVCATVVDSEEVRVPQPARIAVQTEERVPAASPAPAVREVEVEVDGTWRRR